MTSREDILSDIRNLMIEYGPDGHTDGSDNITAYICYLLSVQKTDIHSSSWHWKALTFGFGALYLISLFF